MSPIILVDMSEIDPKQKTATSIFFQKPTFILALVLVLSTIIGVISFSRTNNQSKTATQNILSSSSSSSNISSAASSNFSSSNSTQSSISSIQTASSSSIIISSAAPKPEANLATYTNPFLPSLKIAYNDTWKFETSTEPNKTFPALINRKVTLSKGETKLNFSTVPGGPMDCVGDYNSMISIISTKNLGNGVIKRIEKITDLTPNSPEFPGVPRNVPIVAYGKFPTFSCGMGQRITSNINLKDLPNGRPYSQSDKVEFSISIFLSNNRADNPLISEIDQIISDSSLW